MTDTEHSTKSDSSEEDPRLIELIISIPYSKIPDVQW